MNIKMDQIASRYSTSSYNSGELFKVLGTYVLEVNPGDAKKVGRTKGRSRTGKHVYVEPRDIGVVRDKVRGRRVGQRQGVLKGVRGVEGDVLYKAKKNNQHL